MENWKTHFLSFIVIWAFLIVALASEDDKLLVSSNTPCTDEATLNSEPLPADNGHPITYEVKVIDRETNQPLPEMTVKVDAISYNCLTIEACPDKCYMKSTFQADGQFIGLTNANGTIKSPYPTGRLMIPKTG